MTARNNSAFDFSGARVLVTGGTAGIGLAIASAFASAGAGVTITGTRGSAGDYHDTDLGAFEYRQLQVQDSDQLQAVAAGLEGLDILINNAGASYPGGRDEWQPEVFSESLQINLTSAFTLARACQPLLCASQLAGGASVIGIASLTSFFGNPMIPGYGAAKAGLVQLTKTLAIQWAGDGIRVNSVAAGMTETRMTGPALQMDEVMTPMLARTPQRRWGQPDEIAQPVLFLCSAQASFITGETLISDGGFCAVG